MLGGAGLLTWLQGQNRLPCQLQSLAVIGSFGVHDSFGHGMSYTWSFDLILGLLESV